MPYFGKQVLTAYIHTDCQRRLRLSLYPEKETYQPERDALDMPPEQPPRPGLQEFRKAGDEWQDEVLSNMETVFGASSIIGESDPLPSGAPRYKKILLEDHLGAASPGQFLIEASYSIAPAGGFERHLGIARYRPDFSLDYSDMRPDIIEVLSPGTYLRRVTPEGLVEALPAGDPRTQLRVLDIKLSADPSPGYFAEVALYSMTLAGWLEDKGLSDRYVVIPEGAVWPGTYERSKLLVKLAEHDKSGTTPTFGELRAAMAEDIEELPFEAYGLRLRKFFQDDLRIALSAPDWKTLDWHVDNRCKGCDYLGQDWRDRTGKPTWDERHCIPMAEAQDHLSRVAFISRGASKALRAGGVVDVPDLASRTAADPVFDSHQVLKASRTVVSGRADSLQTNTTGIPPAAGTAAALPRWADLRIYITADFDAGSAITFALGVKAFWLEPQAYGTPPGTPRANHTYRHKVFVIDEKDLRVEERELLAFLEHIDEIVRHAKGLHPDTTLQIYIWDDLQYKHLARVIGRHLAAIMGHSGIRHLAWLFPSEETLPNPAMSTRESPITIVREIVRTLVAAPIPHYYNLLRIARMYHPAALDPTFAEFSIHPLFDDFLSDQIPSERAHVIWTKSSKPSWVDHVSTLVRAVKTRLSALEEVTKRLGQDLSRTLVAKAPHIAAAPPDRVSGVSFDGNLWYHFAKLDEALSNFEVQQIRAMPPHEREARFKSARLTRRLSRPDETSILTRHGLGVTADYRVYELGPGSREVRFGEDDFNVALAPENNGTFLDRSFFQLSNGTPLAGMQGTNPRSKMEDVTSVSIVHMDREAGIVAVRSNQRYPQSVLDDIETHLGINLSVDVMLDPVHKDYFTRKLQDALHEIGTPPISRTNCHIQSRLAAIGLDLARHGRAAAHTPPADFLWDAGTMHGTSVARTLGPVKAVVEGEVPLNASQQVAWEAALTRRLQHIWGPPGTGKSRTARAVVDGAVVEAYQTGRSIRVLICSATYNAFDNVLLKVNEDLGKMLPAGVAEVHRLRSGFKALDPNIPPAIDTPGDWTPGSRATALKSRLEGNQGITVVGSTPEQIYQLLKMNGGTALGGLFDMILIDEASQMDVAHAVLALCSLAQGGSVVLAGDPKQLPPIHKATPPEGLDALVGSIYVFLGEFQGVSDCMLEENYRSNETLVEFSKVAGYKGSLHSHSPDLKLNLVSPLPTTRPADWPAGLHWTPEWSEILDPGKPSTCFIYEEGFASQWNRFEADAVAAMIYLLHGKVADNPEYEKDHVTGAIIPRSTTAYDVEGFWRKAVGVVTPHRAQRALIVTRLQEIFARTGASKSLIRDAVDTVERFQGQQRDIIISSFALGDPDAIREEDEFLMSLNRFNVMSSRPRTKLVVLASQEVVDHISSDVDVVRNSMMLKSYIGSFCRTMREMRLGAIEGGTVREVKGIFKHR